ncbi:MAG: ABC transporter ATP-binding protein [bacterium]|nr:ABC transporter ATP-binding protein [bacterium]
MNYIVETKNLNYTYPDGHEALRDINLQIEKGEIFGIIGPTGAGKSTLLQHLNGILKGDGEITIDGTPIDKKNEKTIREKVGIVFQNPDDQLFCPTVYDDLSFGLFNLGLKADEIATKITDILEQMNLAHLKDMSSHHLSFGEKKRVALATTLVMNPMVLALDEPFANLDYRSMMNLVEMIRKLSPTRIIISQDILLALALCNRIALLDKGRIVEIATPQELANDHALLARSGLDFAPYLEIIKPFLQ